MFKQLITAFGILLLICTGPVATLAQSYSSLESVVNTSDVVAVAKVNLAGADNGPVYTMSILRAIKGSPPATISANLSPSISDKHDLDQIRMRVQGKVILVFLKQDATGHEAVNDALLFVPIASPLASEKLPTDPVASTYTLLCDSLNDPVYRLGVSGTLSGVIDPDVVLAMSKYIDDPDDSVKDAVLTCMAVNSQVAAIPLIARFADEKSASNTLVLCSLWLSNYHSKEAVPYMNPLVWNSSRLVRQGAATSLCRSADSSSAPYLILALRDPSPDYSVSASASAALASHILKEINPYEETSHFVAHYQSDVLVFYNWWSDELMGKHLASDDPSVVQSQSQESSTALPATVQDINPLLFKPYPSLRERAIAALLHKADHSSIPYLVLALQDPDDNVSYYAYVILRRLLGVLCAPLAQDSYKAQQDEATKPLYAWWSDEMLGKHMRRLPNATSGWQIAN